MKFNELRIGDLFITPMYNSKRERVEVMGKKIGLDQMFIISNTQMMYKVPLDLEVDKKTDRERYTLD